GLATRQELQLLLGQDVRKVLITSIHKFGEAGGRLNERSNIIVMVDEAHRTQEGDLGRKMREALPNAFLFGLTGTPINRADRNTFWSFGADEDDRGYLSRYSFQDSIRDKATLPLHFETPEVRLKIDRAAIDEAFSEVTGNLAEQDRHELGRPAGVEAACTRQRRRRKTARPLPRPCRPAEIRYRHQQIAHWLRCSHPAGDVSRQADEGPQSSAGHLPHQPHLRPGEDAR